MSDALRDEFVDEIMPDIYDELEEVFQAAVHPDVSRGLAALAWDALMASDLPRKMAEAQGVLEQVGWVCTKADATLNNRFSHHKGFSDAVPLYRLRALEDRHG